MISTGTAEMGRDLNDMELTPPLNASVNRGARPISPDGVWHRYLAATSTPGRP